MNNAFWIVILLILSLSGYVISYFLYQNNIKLEQKALDAEVNRMKDLGDRLTEIRDDKEITLEELKASRERLDILIVAAESRDTSKLSLQEALDILEALK